MIDIQTGAMICIQLIIYYVCSIVAEKKLPIENYEWRFHIDFWECQIQLTDVQIDDITVWTLDSRDRDLSNLLCKSCKGQGPPDADNVIISIALTCVANCLL